MIKDVIFEENANNFKDISRILHFRPKQSCESSWDCHGKNLLCLFLKFKRLCPIVHDQNQRYTKECVILFVLITNSVLVSLQCLKLDGVTLNYWNIGTLLNIIIRYCVLEAVGPVLKIGIENQ